MDRAAQEIALYYDRLARWTLLTRPFGYGGGRSSLSVHRALADPAAGGRPTPTRLHDLLAPHLTALPTSPHVLDAGCGFGGVVIDVVRRSGGTAVGLTLSSAQASVARRAVELAHLNGRVQILVQNYDRPPAGPFDLVIAIESLAHSPLPESSLAALIRVLAPTGILVLVDDMPEPAADTSPNLEVFKSSWRCPVLWSHARYTEELSKRRLSLVVDQDLTSALRPRGARAIDWLKRINRTCHHAIPIDTWRAILDSHHGGLALERLYRSGLVRYRLLVARPS